MYHKFNILVAEERRVFLRERSNKLYSVTGYFIARVTSDLPHLIITTNIFLVLVYISSTLR